jgi:hypothetical protein
MTNPDQRRRGRFSRIGCGVGLGVVAWGTVATDPARGQEALRTALADQRNIVQRQATENIPYNLKLGPVSLRFDANLGMEYNDNINVADQARQDDFILRPVFNVSTFWPVTQRNTIHFNIGAGYAKYLNSDENDTLYIAPGSEISFDVYVEDVRLNFHDRFSYFQNPLQEGAVSGTNGVAASFGTAVNVVGVRADWNLNKLLLTVGYDHQNSFATSEDFSYLDLSSEFFYLRAGVLVSPAISTGLEVSGGLTRYVKDVQGDNSQISVGPFADWQLSRHMKAAIRAGYVTYSFDPSSVITNAADSSSFYGSLQIDHQLNANVSHSLSIGEQLQLGVNSSALQLFYVRHAAVWRMIRGVDLNTTFYYEHGQEDGASLRGNAEEYDRFGFGLSVGVQLFRKVITSLAYNITLKESNLPQRDYYQNSFLLNVSYRF